MRSSIPNWSYTVGGETYTYNGWEDVGDDVIKIFHDIRDSDGNMFDGPWSPYVVPTKDQFIEFVIETNRFRSGLNYIHPNKIYGA